MTTPITIEEINQHIQCCDECGCAILRRLRDALVSGEYALISKAERERVAKQLNNWSDGDWMDNETEEWMRQLLHLYPPTRTETPE